MRAFILFLAFFLSACCHLPPVEAATFTVFGLSGTDDPTVVAKSANIDNIYLKTSAPRAIYRKTDNGSTTNWTLISSETAVGGVATQVPYYNASGILTSPTGVFPDSLIYDNVLLRFGLFKAPQGKIDFSATSAASGNGSAVILGRSEAGCNYGTHSLQAGFENCPSGTRAVSFGDSNISSGDYSFSIGNGNQALGVSSVAEGSGTIATGDYSHTEGDGTSAGFAAHAEGQQTSAQGTGSHAEGFQTVADTGNYCHAEGNNTECAADNSHAEGLDTTANGNQSHASGNGTSTNRASQTAVGEFNSTATDELFSVGNGANAGAKNTAFAVKENGHLLSNQVTAPGSTVNANAGTGATCTVAHATDTTGEITLDTGAALWAAGEQCQVDFTTAYGVAPICTISPANTNAAAAGANTYVSSTTAKVSVNFVVAATAALTHIWNYFCVQTY